MIFDGQFISNNKSFNVLLIGHCCHDIMRNGQLRMGGSIAYMSSICNALGIQPGVITSFGSDFLFFDPFYSTCREVICVPSHFTTTFENIYTDQGRVQKIHNKASNITIRDLKEIEKPPDVVVLAPIADELDAELCRAFPDSITIATVQGWLRTWDESGWVRQKDFDLEVLKGIDILILSTEDYPGIESHISRLVEIFPLIVITDNINGAWMYSNEYSMHFPSYTVREVDPTGAGDAFAAGFFITYINTGDYIESMISGHTLASLNIERSGVEHITHQTIQNRFKDYPRNLIKKL